MFDVQTVIAWQSVRFLAAVQRGQRSPGHSRKLAAGARDATLHSVDSIKDDGVIVKNVPFIIF